VLAHTIQMDIRWSVDPIVGLRHNRKAKKNNMLTHEKLVVHQVLNDENDPPRYRIMVLGTDVQTVQTVSRYCLGQGVEVLPYYGVPTGEEITLFDPKLFVLCTPLPDFFLKHLNGPCIVWSSQAIAADLPRVSNRGDLEQWVHQYKFSR
jgi:hypothetical protein